MNTHPVAAMPLPTRDLIEVASREHEGGQRLDWASFRARFYPQARSHDYESLAAYIEYQRHPERT